MESDVQHEEDDAELADHGHGVVGLEQAEHRGTEDDSRHELAEDRRVPEAARDGASRERCGEDG